MELYKRGINRMDTFPPSEKYRPTIREGLRLGKNPLKSKNDPLGSWTGTAVDGVFPTQDADDL